MSPQALWDVLERDREQLRTLVRLMQSPLTDCSSTEAFLDEVSCSIPEFEQRFHDHPTTKTATSGKFVTVMPNKAGVTAMRTGVELNLRVGRSRRQGSGVRSWVVAEAV